MNKFRAGPVYISKLTLGFPMKALRTIGLAMLGLFITWAPHSASAQSVNVGVFYNQLAPYGNWLQASGYGYVWQPNVGSGWRPYSDGQWVYTDDGWYWNSNENWGWATYHYGRWVNLDGYGWCWVPGSTWAPAWVSWRTSNDYVGWAPLPPEAAWQPDTGIQFGVSFGFDIGPGYYNFCPNRYFGYGDVGRYCLPPQNNVNIIEQTTNVTNIVNNNNVVYNGGPNYAALSRNAQIRRAQIDRVNAADPAALRGRWQGNRLRVATPHVNANRAARPAHIAGRVPPGRVNRGWANIKDQQRAAALRQHMKAEAQNARHMTPQQRQAAAQRHERQVAAAQASNPAANQTAAQRRHERQVAAAQTGNPAVQQETAQRRRERQAAAAAASNPNATAREQAARAANRNRQAHVAAVPNPASQTMQERRQARRQEAARQQNSIQEARRSQERQQAAQAQERRHAAAQQYRAQQPRPQNRPPQQQRVQQPHPQSRPPQQQHHAQQPRPQNRPPQQHYAQQPRPQNRPPQQHQQHAQQGGGNGGNKNEKKKPQ
jgi:hypothetical protein